MTLPLQSMWFSQASLEGQPDTISRRGKARAGGTGGSAMLSLGRGGGVKKNTGMQLCWGGWCVPKEEMLQRGFLVNQRDPGCADSTGRSSEEQGSRADERQVVRARGTEPTGVTQM